MKISALSYKKMTFLQIFGFFPIFCYHKANSKNMIKLSFILASLFFFFLFPSFLGATTTDITDPGFLIDLSQIDPVNQGAAPITGGSSAITMLLKKIGDFLLFLVPVIAGVALIVAGYFYILSSGDTEKASRAKNIMKWNAIGIVLALSSYAIIAIIASILDANI